MNAVKTLQTTENSLEQFYQELVKSPELQAHLKTASDPESLCQMAVQLGAKMGYNFSIEQARAAMEIEIALDGESLEENNLSKLPPMMKSKMPDNCNAAPF
jgi:Nif11 domain